MPPKKQESDEPSAADIAYWDLLYWAQKATPKTELRTEQPKGEASSSTDKKPDTQSVGSKGPSLLTGRSPTPY